MWHDPIPLFRRHIIPGRRPNSPHQPKRHHTQLTDVRGCHSVRARSPPLTHITTTHHHHPLMPLPHHARGSFLPWPEERSDKVSSSAPSKPPCTVRALPVVTWVVKASTAACRAAAVTTPCSQPPGSSNHTSIEVTIEDCSRECEAFHGRDALLGLLGGGPAVV